MAMVQAVEPYLTWLRTTAQQCLQTASSTQLAVAAFNSVHAAVVPTAQVTANRTRLAQLLATNRFGRNLPAIAETEDQYQIMWANNSAAMGRYQTASAQATTLAQFVSPPSVTNATGLAAQATVVPAATTSAAPAVISSAASPLASVAGFDPNSGWFGLGNKWFSVSVVTRLYGRGFAVAGEVGCQGYPECLGQNAAMLTPTKNPAW